MTSVITPNVQGDVTRPNASTKGQLFESVKQQWEASSFDQLFQSATPEHGNAPAVMHRSISEDRSPNLPHPDQKADIASKLPQNETRLGQGLEATQVHALAASNIPLLNAPSANLVGGVSTGLQSLKTCSIASGTPEGELSTRVVTVRPSDMPTDSADISTQVIVVGVESGKARVWMRGSGLESTKAQLIAKIRTELSWAGMALETFVLNGQRLVGID